MRETLDTKLLEQSISIMELDQFFHSRRMQLFVERAYRTCVPMDFFTQPASSSGKYHPSYALGVGGLVRHTKAAMIMAKMLFPLYNFSPREEDLIMGALALHDVAKPSKLHPLEVEAMLEPLMDRYYHEVKEVVPLIETHMGQWDQFGKLPQPRSTREKFVHLCDYIASRREISIEVNSREEKL